MTISAHSAKATWPTSATTQTARYFWAECTCGWHGPTVKRLATAEAHVDAHLVKVKVGL